MLTTISRSNLMSRITQNPCFGSSVNCSITVKINLYHRPEQTSLNRSGDRWTGLVKSILYFSCALAECVKERLKLIIILIKLRAHPKDCLKEFWAKLHSESIADPFNPGRKAAVCLSLIKEGNSMRLTTQQPLTNANAYENILVRESGRFFSVVFWILLLWSY